MRRAPVVLDDGRWVDAVVAYRCWGTHPENGVMLLRSVATKNSVWPLEPIPAICNIGERAARVLNTSRILGHEAPATKCGCGWWACEDYDVLNRLYPAKHYIRGEVYMWGTIRRHTDGYRSEFAKVAAIFEPTVTDVDDSTQYFTAVRAKLAAATYGVPLVQAPASQPKEVIH